MALEYAAVSQSGSPVGESTVRAILKARLYRQKLFGEGMFADPAWDMLLELYAAELGCRQLCVTSVCIGSGVPCTTALRWLAHLADGGWVARHGDPHDARRRFVSLTPKSISVMNEYFGSSAVSNIC